MIRQIFDLLEEPRGEVLRRLMRALQQHSSGAMIVLRDDFHLDESARALLARLEPFFTERTRSSSWPGTTLLGEEATVLRFALNDTVLDELLAAADGLFAWKHPKLPEDLALLRDDGTAILASICHERDAYLEITDEEYGTVAVAVPELVRLVRRRAGDQ